MFGQPDLQTAGKDPAAIYTHFYLRLRLGGFGITTFPSPPKHVLPPLFPLQHALPLRSPRLPPLASLRLAFGIFYSTNSATLDVRRHMHNRFPDHCCEE
jgi:hypothetical protein